MFPKRSTAGAEINFPADAVETIADRATRLLQIRNANTYLASPTGKRWITTLMVLAALEAGARSALAASARSGLPLTRVEEILGYMRIARWTSKHNALTSITEAMGRAARRSTIVAGNHRWSAPCHSGMT